MLIDLLVRVPLITDVDARWCPPIRVRVRVRVRVGVRVRVRVRLIPDVDAR